MMVSCYTVRKKKKQEVGRMMKREKTAYETGLEDGFSVKSARQYYPDKQNDRNIDVEHWVYTPYEYKGVPVLGYGVASIRPGEERSANTCEFWVDGRNVTDRLFGNSRDEKVFENTKSGEKESCQEALAKLESFVVGASDIPHVFTYDEYMEAKTPQNARLQLDPPTEESYETYLKWVENAMLGRSIKFVGEVTHLDQLDDLRMQMPSFGEMMDEIEASEDGFGFGE